MLNELTLLERGLSAVGAAVSARHPDIKDMARGEVLRVRLDEGGVLSGVEIIPGNARGGLWTLRDGQQNGFPGLRTSRGLLAVNRDLHAEHDRRWAEARSATQKRAALELLVANTSIATDLKGWPTQGHLRRIADRLEALRHLEDDPRTAAVPTIFSRFLAGATRQEPLLAAVAMELMRLVGEGDESWLEVAQQAFTGPVPLVFDVAWEESRFSRDAGDPRQIGAVTAALEHSKGGGSSDAAGDCALSGPSRRLLRGNFPQPNLPGLGQTYLFARNRDIPAMSRYGRSGAGSMPVDAELATRLSGAVVALTGDELRGRTWRLIPAEVGNKLDLFIASLPAHTDLQLADALAIEDDEGGWAAVTVGAKGVLDLLDAHLASLQPQEEIQLLILRTLDPANRKAVYNRLVSVRSLHSSALRWHEAMQNWPKWIRFFIPAKSGGIAACPSEQKPLSLTRLSRISYVNGGERVVELRGISAGDALDLYLGAGDSQIRASRIIAMILARKQGMLSRLVQVKARGPAAVKEFDPKAELRRHSLRSVAWISALLYIAGRPKEAYMHEPGFKLGQLLAAVDAVHIGYCADLRGGEIPPTLLGNSLFAIAGRNPVRALEMLQARWRPYGGWAKRVTVVSEKARKLMGGPAEQTGWQMRRGLSQARLAAQLGAELRGCVGDLKRPDDLFRAELLLGYMAGAQHDQPKDDNAPADPITEGIQA